MPILLILRSARNAIDFCINAISQTTEKHCNIVRFFWGVKQEAWGRKRNNGSLILISLYFQNSDFHINSKLPSIKYKYFLRILLYFTAPVAVHWPMLHSKGSTETYRFTERKIHLLSAICVITVDTLEIFQAGIWYDCLQRSRPSLSNVPKSCHWRQCKWVLREARNKTIACQPLHAQIVFFMLISILKFLGMLVGPLRTVGLLKWIKLLTDRSAYT